MNTSNTFCVSRRLSGFVLVEVIASIAILMLAIPAALTIASKSIFLAGYSKDQVVATYLSEEGIEIIRNKRDENMLGGIPWSNGFDSPSDCESPQRCRVDYGVSSPDPLIDKCTGGCSLVLSVDTVSGAYAHQPVGGTWASTPFSRYVQTDNIPGVPNEIRVKSVVTYLSHGISKTVTMTENLTSWIQ